MRGSNVGIRLRLYKYYIYIYSLYISVEHRADPAVLIIVCRGTVLPNSQAVACGMANIVTTDANEVTTLASTECEASRAKR